MLDLHLHNQTVTVAYVYDSPNEKVPLPSIYESSDSNKSDKSDESSDTEKKGKQTEEQKAKEKQAKESLKQKLALIEQDIEKLDENNNTKIEKTSLAEPLEQTQSPAPLMPDLNMTMPLPQHKEIMTSPIDPQYFSQRPTAQMNKNYFYDPQFSYSESSFDNDAINEE